MSWKPASSRTPGLKTRSTKRIFFFPGFLVHVGNAKKQNQRFDISSLFRGVMMNTFITEQSGHLSRIRRVAGHKCKFHDGFERKNVEF